LLRLLLPPRPPSPIARGREEEERLARWRAAAETRGSASTGYGEESERSGRESRARGRGAAVETRAREIRGENRVSFFFVRCADAFLHIPPIWWNELVPHIRGIFHSGE
jgi:hypothetical protein